MIVGLRGDLPEEMAQPRVLPWLVLSAERGSAAFRGFRRRVLPEKGMPECRSTFQQGTVN